MRKPAEYKLAAQTKIIMTLTILARSLVQRIYHRKVTGVTDYYRNSIRGRIECAKWQLDKLKGNTVLEVGCGVDMHTSLVAALVYNKKSIAFDIKCLASVPLINFTMNALGSEKTIQSLDELPAIGIQYVVGNNLDGVAGYDGIVSTAVIEHMECRDIENMFRQGRANLVKKITASIDFKDHWSYITSSSPDNFYYVSDAFWRFINVNRMFQNRLRMSDINKIADKYGYQVGIKDVGMMDIQIYRNRLSNAFIRYGDDDLKTGQVMIEWELRIPV